MSDAVPLYAAFDGPRRLAHGDLAQVALAARRAEDAGAAGPVLMFADATGRALDLDLRGDEAAILARFAPQPEAAIEPEARGRGRPKLGVTAREVTLLPRHWDWLAAQPGGASVALRKLVEAARRQEGEGDRIRRARDAAYAFMSAMAGDRPGFEEAARALFAGDRAGVEARLAAWPKDVAAHVLALAYEGAAA